MVENKEIKRLQKEANKLVREESKRLAKKEEGNRYISQLKSERKNKQSSKKCKRIIKKTIKSAKTKSAKTKLQ